MRIWSGLSKYYAAADVVLRNLSLSSGHSLWRKAAVPLYGSEVSYSCGPGRMFDTDGDGAGDSDNVTAACLWSSSWSPATLPSCAVTHCISNLSVPADSFLQEVTSDWTPIR